MFCPNCGKEIEEGASFCGGCGSALVNTPPMDRPEDIAAAMPPIPPEAPASAVEPQPAQTFEAEPTHKPTPPPPKSKPKNSGCVIIAIFAVLGLLALLLVVVAVVVCLLLFPVFGRNSVMQEHKWFHTEATQPSDWGTTPATEEYTVPAETEAVEEPTTDGNPYSPYLTKYAQYVLPDSNSAFLGRGDISDLTDEEWTIARQEIYARHGVRSDDMQLQAYFEARSWYKASAGTPEFNEYEEANLMLFRIFEAQQDGSLYQSSNPYLKLQREPDLYMSEYSNTRFLNADDLRHMSLEQLQITRNEIYARHGYIFGYDEMAEYFYTKQWYYPSVHHEDFDDSVFTEYEKLNLDIILAYEKRAKGVTFSSSNPFRDYYDPSRDYIFYQSSYSYLHENDLYGMDWEEYCLARNEILARNGYTFSDKDLLEYFLHYSWYVPNTPAGKTEYLDLNNYEEENSELLRAEQSIAEKVPDLDNLDTSMTYTVSTDKFTLTLPAYWKNYAIVDTGSSSASFYEKLSRDTYGGSLFHISVFYDTGYTDYPSYELITTYTESDGRRAYIVMTFPTDVQFRPGAYRLYSRMEDDLNMIANTVKPLGDKKFSES